METSTTVEGKTESVKSAFNTLGKLTSYTDAAGTVSTYEYEPEGNERLTKVNDGKGTQTYTYEETSGEISKLEDSNAGTFNADYDVEGNLTDENYPNGLNAEYQRNQVGEVTSLSDIKTTNCTEKCEWYKDSIVSSIHGQWVSQTSTLGKQAYAYDAIGRLTQVQEEPIGKGCTTRVYTYDEDTNRTSLTRYPPNSKSECSTESPTVEKHTYDEADRLTDTGVTSDAFGNTLTLPTTDADGTELKSTYYTDNQLASQEQNGQTVGYKLDPTHRIEETVSTGKITADETYNYTGPGNSPS